MEHNKIVSKQEFIENIKQWVTIDSQLKIVNEKTRKMREMKSGLTQNLCGYANQSNFKDNKIGITDGTLSFYDKKEYTPLTYSYVEQCLGELIADKKQVGQIIQYLKEKREIQTSTDIRRTYNKKMQIEN
jgi:hypothetical protein|tara:strand:+ start:431 stop:820 length:390 start_codon:yes stop_codon:yes gene_type:complete